MAESRSACEARARKAAGKRRLEVRKHRDDEVRSISSDWKEGFAKLKAENDQRQRSLQAFMKEQEADILQELNIELNKCRI
jgi:hypothetical protein